MGWASSYIDKLKTGESVSFRPRGYSMTGKIKSGNLCTVNPILKKQELKVGDIVLCAVGKSEYLHLIHDIKWPLFKIGNNKGRINGWICHEQIFGKCVKVEK